MDNKSLTILVIDTDQDTLDSLEALITRAFPGSETITALKSLVGFNLAHTHNPDVVLLDGMMTDMDSIELCRRFKTDEALCKIPIIFVTAIPGDKECLIQALEAGADIFLSKPVNETELKAQVRAMAKIKTANLKNQLETEPLEALLKLRTEELEKEYGERRKSEEALSKNQMMLNLILDTIPQSIFWKDTESRYLGCNQVFAKAAGLDNPAEIVGKTDYDLPWPHHEAEEYRADDKEVISNKLSKRHIIEPLQQADGTRLWVDTSKMPLLEDSGKPFALLGIYDDITERKLAEETLFNTQANLTALVENTLDNIWSINTNYEITYINKVFARAFNTVFGVLLVPGTSILQSLPDQIKSTWKERYDRILSGERIVFVDAIEAFGKLIHIEVAGNPIVVQGEVIGASFFGRDITERKLVEDQLKNTQSNLAAIVENTLENIWAINLNYEITFINEVFTNAFKACFGVALCPGKNALYELPHDLKPLWKERFDRVLNGENFVVYDEIQNGDTVLYIEVAFNPIRADGKIIGASLYGRDITEMKKSANEILNRERSYRDIFNSSNDALFVHDINSGAILDVNDQMVKIFGFPDKEEVLKSSMFELSVIEEGYTLNKAIEAIRIAAETGMLSLEWRARRKNGEKFWAQVTLTKVSIQGTERILAAVRDISDSKLAGESIRKNERIFAEINECLVNLGPDYKSNVTELTSLCGRLLGATCALYNRLDDNLLCSIGQWNTPPDYEAVDKPEGHICYDVIQKGKRQTMVVPNLPDSHYFKTDPNVSRYALKTYVGHPVFSGGVAVGSLCVVFQDDREFDKSDLGVLSILATALGSEEQRLNDRKSIQKSEEFIRIVMDNLPIGLAVNSVDPSVEFNYFNDNFIRFYRTTREALSVSDGFWDAVYEESSFREEIRKRVLKDCETGDPQLMHWDDIPITRKDSETRFISTRNVPLTEKSLMISVVWDVTERKQAEEQLRIKELAIAGSMNAIVLADLKGNLTFVNPAFLDMWGYSTENEVLGKNSSDFWQTRTEATDILKVLLTQHNWKGELTGKRFDGTAFVAEVAASLILDPNGQPLCLLGVFADITERKEAEAALIKSDELNRRLLKTIPDIVIRTDLNGLITFVNEPIPEYYSFLSTDKLINRSIFSFVAAKDIQRVIENTRLMFEKVLGIQEYSLMIDDHSMMECEVNGDVIRDTEGNPAGMVFVIRDITERKQAEKALQESETRFREMFFRNPQSVQIVDINGFTIHVNEAHTKLFGALPPSDYSVFNDPLIERQGLAQLWNKVRSGEVVDFPDFQYNTSELNPELPNNPLWLQMTVFSLTDSKGKPKRFVLMHKDITEKKRAEEALIKSNNKYIELSTLLRLMADNMPDMLWAKNLNREYIFTNKAICMNLLNASDTDEPLGKTDIFFSSRERNAHPENPQWHTFGEICMDSDAKTFEEMKPIQFDEYGNVKGKFLFLDVHKAPLYNEKGQLIGVVGSARDVTIAKETENQLRKLSQAVEQSPASVVISNTNGDIEYVNPKFTEITGYTFEESLGKNPKILKSGIQPTKVYQDMWEAISSGRTWHGEFHNKKKNGELFWESASISPILNKNGEITHYLAVKEDITRRKNLEEVLKHQTLLRELLMEISSGFINIPFNQVDESVNNALKKMGLFVNADRSYTFDYDWGKNICNNIYEWCAEGISPEIDNLQGVPLDMMQDWVESHIKGEAMYVPDVFKLPRGAVREILEPQGIKSVMTAPMMNDGRCIGFVGFDSVRDYHEYTNTELQLLKLFAQMLANLKMRKEIVDQLLIAKEKAEESNLLKTAFLQNLSHEIRTPLNGIIGFSGLLKRNDITSDERNTYADILIERGWHLTSIINDILTVSSLETKQEQLYEEDFNINTQLTNQMTAFAQQAEQKGIKLVLNSSLSGPHAVVKADKTKLGQILNNLFTNALKFTIEGEIELGCHLNGEELEFRVRDTGIGIEKSKHHLIFERFAQANDTIRRDFGGTGLGLSISKGFTELMGGRIWVESEPGQGSTFIFTLPYHPVKAEQGIKHDVPELINPGKKLTVLVAEDEKTNFLLLDIILKKLNVRVLHAENGQEAVDLIKKEPVDLVLMDIKMPEMNGYIAAKIIKELKPNVPVIAQTAHSVQIEIEKFKDAFDDYFTKPINVNDLKQKVIKYIERNS